MSGGTMEILGNVIKSLKLQQTMVEMLEERVRTLEKVVEILAKKGSAVALLAALILLAGCRGGGGDPLEPEPRACCQLTRGVWDNVPELRADRYDVCVLEEDLPEGAWNPCERIGLVACDCEGITGTLWCNRTALIPEECRRREIR